MKSKTISFSIICAAGGFLLPLQAEGADSTRVVDIEAVTIVASPKEHTLLRHQPVAVSLFDEGALQAHHVESVKGISQLTPNLFIPDYGSSLTSAVYIRGVGSRVGTPAVGLYVDNVPFTDKSAYDFQFLDIERVDVLRGPQGTLYGRNTMGGLIKVHTRNPFRHQGTAISLGGSTGDNTGRLSLVHRAKVGSRLAFTAGGYLHEERGAWRNVTRREWADPQRAAGAHLRTVWLPAQGLKVDFTASHSYTDEGGYAYRYRGAVGGAAEQYPHLIGSISSNRPNGYYRSLTNAGLQIEWKWKDWVFTSVSGYQHVRDGMNIDQDFLAADIFTLRQSQRQHTFSQEFAAKAGAGRRWKHTTGIYAFHQWLHTEAPVTFWGDGVSMIQSAMDAGMQNAPVSITLTDPSIRIPGSFDTPVLGTALFHQSEVELLPRFTLTAGVRIDYERLQIDYDTRATLGGTMTGMGYTAQPFTQTIVYDDGHSHDYFRIQPRIGLSWELGGKGSNLYTAVSRGVRSGGYNIQMFSEIIQQAFRHPMSEEERAEEAERMVRYAPEYSWNYEAGAHLNAAGGRMAVDAALFYISTRDQQISRFTEGGLGRIMVNAGRATSYGAELSVRATPVRPLSIHLSYGYTCATFRRYDGGMDADGSEVDYRGNYIPFVPRHTLSLGGVYTWAMPARWAVQSLALRASCSGAGRIYWTEQNTAWQDFYLLVDAGLVCRMGLVELDFWGRNLADTAYDTFYFESMNRGFSQRGLPVRFGVDMRFSF